MLARSLVCLSVIALSAGIAQAGAANDPEPGSPLTLYLNGSGARLDPGGDNSHTNTSSLLRRRGLRSLAIPRFQGSAAEWTAHVACVREQLAAFRIDVVDQRPRDGNYIMAAVGGSPQMLGYSRNVTGVASFGSTINRNSVFFVFERAMDGAPRATCETTLQEFGHALGLDHVYWAADAMSYLPSRERKSFTDVDASCGEHEARICASGAATQNSFKIIARAVGLREREPDRAEAGGEETDNEEADGEERGSPDSCPAAPSAARPADTKGPDLEIISSETGQIPDGNGFVQIAIWAEDASDISNVELGWTDGDSSSVFSCAEMPASAPAWCINEGNLYVFVLAAGGGAREFAVRATDGAGNQTISEHRRIYFKGS